MTVTDARYAVTMGFIPPEQTFPDPERPALRRALPRNGDHYGGEAIRQESCIATDWAQDDSLHPDLFTFGFDTVDLSSLDGLQAACAAVRRAGLLADEHAAAIRADLDGAVIETSSGRRLTVLYIADEGLFMRCAGPNRLAVVGPRPDGANGHGPATSVHADQDVFGTPLRQLMDGRAPSLFRHDSPDAYNHDASLMLCNVWVPLQQVVQPLVLGDGRSLDRVRHQVRLGLDTESFLDRDDSQLTNDIWTFLYDPEQRWFLRSEMDHRSAYVFNTLSTPHSAGTLPGEDVAERYFRALAATEEAVALGDLAGCLRALDTDGVRGLLDADADADADADVAGAAEPAGAARAQAIAPPALARALAEMASVLREAVEVTAAGEVPAAEWAMRSDAARDAVVRKSLEMRVVVSVES